MRKYHQCKHHQSRCNIKTKKIGDVFLLIPSGKRPEQKHNTVQEMLPHFGYILHKIKFCFPLQWVWFPIHYFSPLLFIQNFRMLLFAIFIGNQVSLILSNKINKCGSMLLCWAVQSVTGWRWGTNYILPEMSQFSKHLVYFNVVTVSAVRFELGGSAESAVCSSSHMFKMFHTDR